MVRSALLLIGFLVTMESHGQAIMVLDQGIEISNHTRIDGLIIKEQGFEMIRAILKAELGLYSPLKLAHIDTIYLVSRIRFGSYKWFNIWDKKREEYFPELRWVPDSKFPEATGIIVRGRTIYMLPSGDVKSTLHHEIAHSFWDKLPQGHRDEYVRLQNEGKKNHFITNYCTSTYRTDPGEHLYCESHAAIMTGDLSRSWMIRRYGNTIGLLEKGDQDPSAYYMYRALAMAADYVDRHKLWARGNVLNEGF